MVHAKGQDASQNDMTLTVPTQLAELLQSTPELKQVFMVGGCVRDKLLQLPSKDIDIEVFGFSYEDLIHVLSRVGRTDTVGRSFGVIKVTVSGGETFDFSIPRRDSKTAPGHKGFQIEFDPSITPREAASRRDFTINSLMYDVRQGQLHDYFGGRADLENRILRHTSDAFAEDPLRVLRGMQFTARFNLSTAPETLEQCRAIRSSHSELAVERLREEWFKWASKSLRPSLGLQFLLQTGWLAHYPEIQALVGVPQDPEWHPEGDVFVHTCHCLDALVESPGWQSSATEDRIVLSLAVLSHDMAKPQTTQRVIRDGVERIISPGHEELGGEVARKFLERIQTPHAMVDRIIPLVTNHLAHLQITSPKATRRLARRLAPATILELGEVVLADLSGRPPRPKGPSSNLLEMLSHAEILKLQDQAPKPILLGRHLVQIGMKPGPQFREILDAAFEAQLDGAFETIEGAWKWLQDSPLASSILTTEEKIKLQEMPASSASSV